MYSKFKSTLLVSLKNISTSCFCAKLTETSKRGRLPLICFIVLRHICHVTSHMSLFLGSRATMQINKQTNKSISYSLEIPLESTNVNIIVVLEGEKVRRSSSCMYGSSSGEHEKRSFFCLVQHFENNNIPISLGSIL